ncbi:MAG: NUDIX hydrolase [Myxococcales bacterium]|nr:NUDIX hydrolase [Myxococcales bacterium]
MDETIKRKRYELSTRVAYHNRYFQVTHDRYRLPRDGGEGDYYFVELPGSTMIVPQLDDGRFVLVRQHRYPWSRSSLEFPGGGIKHGLDPLDNAREELREEAGYAASDWRRLGAFAPCNGLTTEMCHVFLARGLSQVGVAPEPTEDLSVVLLTRDELEAAIGSGELWDGQAICCVAFLDRYQGSL